MGGRPAAGGPANGGIQDSRYEYTASSWTPRICSLRNFCNIEVYITQPVLPVLEQEFGAGLVLVPSIAAVVAGLLGVCTGFFASHAAAIGSLNRKLSRGQGRANALCVLFYYAGGWLGITGAGLAYRAGGWRAVVYGSLLLLTIPFGAGLAESRIHRRRGVSTGG